MGHTTDRLDWLRERIAIAIAEGENTHNLSGKRTVICFDALENKVTLVPKV